MYNVVSSLGGYLREDREDFTNERNKAAVFFYLDEAERWIRKTYGRQGFKVYRAVPIGRDGFDQSGEPQVGAD